MNWGGLRIACDSLVCLLLEFNGSQKTFPGPCSISFDLHGRPGFPKWAGHHFRIEDPKGAEDKLGGGWIFLFFDVLREVIEG